jgi:prepilin-type processing-associated H-X9-DG protein
LNFVGPTSLSSFITVSGQAAPGDDSQYNYCTTPTDFGATVVKTFLCPSDTAPTQTTYTNRSGTTWYFGANSYGGNAGIVAFYYDSMSQDGIFYLNSSVKIADITDGTSNTFLFGERNRIDPTYKILAGSDLASNRSGWAWANVYGGFDFLFASTRTRPINWIIPPGTTTDPGYVLQDDRVQVYGSQHTGGANFCFADGSVKFVSDTTAVPIVQALCTRAGGEVVDASQY